MVLALYIYSFCHELLAWHTVDDGTHAGLDIIVVEGHDADKGDVVLQLNRYMARLHIVSRRNANLLDVQFLPLRLQLYPPCDAVPIALRLVSDGMRVLPHPNILDAIVDAHHYLIVPPGLDVVRHIVTVGCRQRHLVPCLMPVHPHGGLNVGALHHQRDALSTPVLGHVDFLPVPSRADIMPLGGEEEGKLDVARLPEGFHSRVIIVAGVIERPRPRRGQ